MFEHSQDGLIEDVDTVAQGNGSFGAYPGVDITFRRTRARDNICTDQGRGPPSSNAIVWAGSPGSSGLRIDESVYFNLCNPDEIVWDADSFEVIQINEDDFSPRPAITLDFPWQDDHPVPFRSMTQPGRRGAPPRLRQSRGCGPTRPEFDGTRKSAPDRARGALAVPYGRAARACRSSSSVELQSFVASRSARISCPRSFKCPKLGLVLSNPWM